MLILHLLAEGTVLNNLLVVITLSDLHYIAQVHSILQVNTQAHSQESIYDTIVFSPAKHRSETRCVHSPQMIHIFRELYCKKLCYKHNKLF